jgi:uncharacterized protein YcbK (DUF882 family)
LLRAGTLCVVASNFPSLRSFATATATATAPDRGEAGATAPDATSAIGRASGAGPASAAPKVLRFVHTHTGETLTAAYSDGSAYDAECLAAVNHLLRDFRTDEMHVIDPALLDLLYDLQVRAGRDAAYEIISGYRSPATNAMLRRQSLGVAEHSQHLLGKAIDVRLAGFPTKTLGEHARTLARGGVGFYERSDFVHIDTGRVRFW